MISSSFLSVLYISHTNASVSEANNCCGFSMLSNNSLLSSSCAGIELGSGLHLPLRLGHTFCISFRSSVLLGVRTCLSLLQGYECWFLAVPGLLISSLTNQPSGSPPIYTPFSSGQASEAVGVLLMIRGEVRSSNRVKIHTHIPSI